MVKSAGGFFCRLDDFAVPNFIQIGGVAGVAHQFSDASDTKRELKSVFAFTRFSRDRPGRAFLAGGKLHAYRNRRHAKSLAFGSRYLPPSPSGAGLDSGIGLGERATSSNVPSVEFGVPRPPAPSPVVPDLGSTHAVTSPRGFSGADARLLGALRSSGDCSESWARFLSFSGVGEEFWATFRSRGRSDSNTSVNSGMGCFLRGGNVEIWIVTESGRDTRPVASKKGLEDSKLPGRFGACPPAATVTGLRTRPVDGHEGGGPRGLSRGRKARFPVPFNSFGAFWASFHPGGSRGRRPEPGARPADSAREAGPPVERRVTAYPNDAKARSIAGASGRRSHTDVPPRKGRSSVPPRRRKNDGLRTADCYFSFSLSDSKNRLLSLDSTKSFSPRASTWNIESPTR